MTQSRATYWAWVENQRSNKANEELERAKQEETAKHNRIMEEQGRQANEEAIRAHKAAEDNARLATQQAEEASKRSYEASINKQKVDERVARMQTTANAAQKQADRDQQMRIASMTNAIQSEQNSISRDLADNTIRRTDAEVSKWVTEADNASRNLDLQYEKYLLDAEDLARKQKDSKAMRDLNKAKFRWEQSQDRFNNAMSLVRAGNESVATGTRALRDLIDSGNGIIRIAKTLFK